MENLIVKVGKVIQESESTHKIDLETMFQWKVFTS